MESSALKMFFKAYGFELALAVVCAAVFIPWVIAEDEARRPKGILFGDIPYYIGTVQSMVQDGDLDLKNQMGGDVTRIQDSIGLGLNGEWYSTHPVLMPVFTVPFYILLGMDAFLVFNVLVMIVMVVVVFLLCRHFAPSWIAFVAALVFAFFTQVMTTLYNYSPDAFSTLMTLIAVLLILKEKPLTGGLFFGLAILSRTTNVVPYVMVFPFLWMGPNPVRATLRLLAASVPFILIFLAMNWHQYGSPFTLSYHRVLANTEDGVIITRISGHFGVQFFWGALWGQLADQEHGLFFHSLPSLIALLGIPLFFRRHRRSALLVFLIVVSLYLFHCFFKLWYISHPGSNRYIFTAIMLMAVPFALLLEFLWNRIPRKGRSQ
ncbi:MAG: glycosyltransferase 87 family protein [Planctomycetota bacterium]